MEQKVYIREGRRFRPIPNVIGMFWNGDTFTKDRFPDSIAVCYDQQGKRAYMASLEVHKGVNWHTADTIALRSPVGYHLPTKAEASLATFRCECLRDDNLYWTQEEASSSSAWTWGWSSSSSFAIFTSYTKSIGYQYLCARLFFGLTL